jgi:predicted lipoprotein with Yx(FWY)xxD motif
VALALAAASLLLTTPALAAASASTDHSKHHTAKPTVRIVETAVGPLLANGTGYTVYMFVRDKRRKDVCRTIKHCERDWPAVTTTGKPVAGPGVKKSLLGSIPYKGKLREVTYKGHPLHTYRFDTSKGSVINIGNRQYGGAWYGLNAKGGVVK